MTANGFRGETLMTGTNHNHTAARMTASLIILSLFSGIMIHAGEQDGPAKVAVLLQAACLRRTIENLTIQFGAGYPHCDEFLKRLKAIESRGAREVDDDTVQVFSSLQREALIANPLVRGAPILFVVRHQYGPDHHNTATFFPCEQREYNDGVFTPGGALKLIDFANGGLVRTLLDVPDGVARDPEVHFDGAKVVFSMRRNLKDSYHLYEINIDGSGLRQLTFAKDVDDLDPLYLPDGGIVFSSTREPKYCMCNRHIMANLYRMDADGANIHQIGKSTLFEGHSSLMPDGRVLYDRWEYVDRNFGDGQALWSVNPDGTNHAIYWGNNTASPGVVIDARIIAESEQAVCVLGSCHDRPWGALAILDRRLGTDGPKPVVRTWPADASRLIRQTGWQIFDSFASVRPKYEDPWPLSDQYFLCARMTGQGEQMGLYLLDVFGNELLLHTEGPGCFDPMPLRAHRRPPVIPPRRDYENKLGYVYVQDVYQGTHMNGVKRGSVKWLRVVELPEKRTWSRPAWIGQGSESPAMNWHDFNHKRILGTVPVEPDGSASFEVPAERFVYFQLLDDRGMMVQSMRSGTLVQPGERAGCIGCHDERASTPSHASPRILQALGRAPSRLDGWYGPPREFGYVAEVQPVLTQHCTGCHDYGKTAGSILNLAPDRDLVFNASYNELWRKGYIHVVGAGPSAIQPAFSWGSHASKLVSHLRSDTRCGGSLSPDEIARIVTWIDLNAPYYSSYACAYPDHLAGRAPLDGTQLARLEALTGVPLQNQAGHETNRGPQISFDRPELSPCLSTLSDHAHPKYQEALGIIARGRATLATRPEADMPGFQACAIDQWREQKYLARQRREQEIREAIRLGRKVYDTMGD